MTPRISIAMATYNGEKYLLDQLESLARQTYAPCELVVGDDGSTDGTITILEEFSRRAPFPVRIIRNPVNLGFGENFLQTASACVGDWIAFCDQDDVWLTVKLERAAQAIRRNPHLNLVLQYAELSDAALNRRGRFSPNRISSGDYLAGQMSGLWVWHGFLQTVRSALITRVQFNDRPTDDYWSPVRPHDQWICTIANALGGVCVLGEPVALYRRHDHSITSSYPRRDFRKKFNEAFATGSEHYNYLSARAARSACALQSLWERTQDPDMSRQFAESASLFRRYAKIQSNRARLYGADGIIQRLECYASLWGGGGYVGPRFFALGLRSALKDAVITIIGGARATAMDT